MPDANDMDLVREYAARNSEPAFETLVRRHVSLVYSVALRQVGNPTQAEEITQAVFLILARKAGRLRPDTILPGWLHETARFASASFLRGELRRQRREQEAYVQSKLQESTADPAWEQLAPLLDEAIGQLGKADRNAVVLRFFQNKSAREIAAALNVHESAAQKRLNRAVEKLRAWFLKRGVAVSADAMTGALLIHSVQGAPAHLAASVLAVSVKGTVVSSSTLTLIKGALKIMAWTKAKTTAVAVAAVILATGTTTIVIKSHTARSARSNANLPSSTWAKFNRQVLTDGINKAHEIPNAIYTYPDGDETTHRYLESIMKMFAKNTGPGRTIKSDRELTEQDIQTRTIYIYGSPQNHSFFRRVRDQLPIVFEDDGIVVGNKKCKGSDVGAIFVCPNPLYPKNQLVIYGTVTPDALIDMNAIFHGPTDYIVFNNATRQFRGVNGADQFLLMGSFNKSDPMNWRVDDTLQVLPPNVLQRATAGVVVAR